MEMAAIRLRAAQQAVLDYSGGMMGVSAVPGSGKTWTLSLLAARLVAEGGLEDDQEVLIVTLVNAAVDHFAARVARFVRARGLLPGIGYRVRTLHGLAHDIVRERPALVGLSDDFQIADERTAQEMVLEAATLWLHDHPDALDAYLAPTVDERRREWLRREQWPTLVVSLASSFIRQAKDLQLSPATLRYRLAELGEAPPLLEMGCAVYEAYQRALALRGMVDFDDLIRLALQALRLDPQYLARLRHRWPYILEDEAQDSSRLQEEILHTLAGPDGNWVRVGDPNQAIYETFTTASPHHLRRFRTQPNVIARDLPNSGRSAQSIIELANYLIRWVQAEHPVPAVRHALAPPYIRPAPPDDPQPNPPDHPQAVRLLDRPFTPRQEVEAVVASLVRWLPHHPDETVAVLVPRNRRGAEVAQVLKERGIPHIELLRSTRPTREAAGALGNIVRYLADPLSARKLATVYRVWRRGERDDDARRQEIERAARLLRRIPRVEDYLWPRAGRDWLAEQALEAEDPALAASLRAFRGVVQRWQEAAVLPIDQLILTLAQELFDRPADLAIAHKLAVMLRTIARLHPEWTLPQLAQELAVIARNRRKFLGFAEEEMGFDPDAHKGEVVVATMHKAKGLEWDRVYLMSVNAYNFPSALPGDTYIAEPWYVRDQLNLEAEMLAQLKALHDDPTLFNYAEGEATQQARYEYAAERVRLLYVGITRARKSLIITWNTGRDGRTQPAAPFIALYTWWASRQEEV